MGLFQKLAGELVDIIEWLDDTGRTLVWRFPRYHNQIKNGARLIVRPGQVAVFVTEGRLADVFEPGHYELKTQNLPILSTLMGWKHGFDSPFKSEVYFVATRQVTDLKWGTPNPVLMRDADFGPVRVRGFGTYTLRTKDPKRLLEQLVGTDGSFEADEIHELVRSIVSQAFADVVGKSEVPLLDLASHYGELSEQVRRVAESRIDDEYGLEIPQLVIVNVSVPAEVEQALDARTSMNVVGDLAGYQSYQLGRSLPDAAKNPAGGLAGAGVGVGMGMAIANRFEAPGATQRPPAAPAPPVMWHFAERGHSIGPIPFDELARAAAQGRITPETLVWSMGMRDW